MIKENKFYVYKITNKINNKIYIGKTNDLIRRYKDHMSIPFSNSKIKDSLVKFYRSIRKYGVINFTQPEILGIYDNESSAYKAETEFIIKFNSYKNGLNSTEGGLGAGSGPANSFYGKKHTNEAKKKMSEKRKKYLETHPNNFLGKKNILLNQKK